MTITLVPPTSPQPTTTPSVLLASHPFDPLGAGTRRELVAGAAMLALLGLTACGDDTPSGDSGSGTRSVATDQGTVRVPADPQRIVVLSGGLAGYLFALGSPVVATDTRVLGLQPDAAGFPATWSRQAQERGTRALPSGDLDLEAVAAARPDLIIGGGQGFTAAEAERDYRKLTAIAPTVLVSKKLDAWQDQLAFLARVVGVEPRARELAASYRRRRDELTKAIALPAQPTAVLLSTPNDAPFLVPETAALPALLTQLGFTMDRVVRKAGNPKLYGTGDSFEISAERLGEVADAPTLIVVSVGGPTAAQLAKRRIYARLPAFRNGNVHELPASSYRPDYYAAIDTLDRLQALFGR